RLVLLLKPGKDPGDPSAYRPLCMLEVTGKLFERIICNRIEGNLTDQRGLSEQQFGFRNRMSTVDAITKVVEQARDAIGGTRWRGGGKEYCLVNTLDVQNAFSSARWPKILQALKELDMPGYLVNLVASYFEDRVLYYNTAEGRQRHS
ncbi:hypothetical protein KR044_013026, partial [Drosophila immigrans]